MPVGLSLLSVFIVPVILLVMWGLCLWQLLSVTLTLMTLISAVMIVLSTNGNLLLLQRNPYAMLIAVVLVIFTVLMLPHIQSTDRPYLIAANSVLLLMMLALHLWRLYLRQSNAYITETDATLGIAYNLLIVGFTLCVPILLIFNRAVPQAAFTYGSRLIAGVCVAILLGTVWLSL